MHFGSTSRPCRDTPGAGELRHHLMRQVGAKSRGLGDVAWPNYVPAALLRGSERLGQRLISNVRTPNPLLRMVLEQPGGVLEQ